MEYVRIMMVHENLANTPRYLLPSGYRFRFFSRGDEEKWVDLNYSAGLFDTKEGALDRFTQEFAPEIDDLEDRCLFLLDLDGKEIGTVMAWKNTHFTRGNYGRLHWVALHPDYQGLRLGKPLVSGGLELMKSLHDKAYLTSETTRYKAIKMYLDFGFKPYIQEGYPLNGWRIIDKMIEHPVLKSYLANIPGNDV